MKILLLCSTIAFLGIGVTEQAKAQKGGSRGSFSGHGWSSGQTYGGNQYRSFGLGNSHVYPYRGLSYGNSYVYPFTAYGYGSTYVYPSYYATGSRYSYYAPSYYSADTSFYPQEPASSQTVIRVLVPDAEAVVFFDGHKTSSAGTERMFSPPSLAAGYTYSYQVTASWTTEGRPITDSRTVHVVAGRASVVDFTRAAPAERLAAPAKIK